MSKYRYNDVLYQVATKIFEIQNVINIKIWYSTKCKYIVIIKLNFFTYFYTI